MPRTSSYWLASGPRKTYPPLQERRETDVVVIGGGIAGLNTAYLLKKAGLRVIVLEKNTLGSGTTGNTTGKVTTQHGLTYAELIERHGLKAARAYADASRRAFDDMKRIIKADKILCDWRTRDNYVYTADPANLKLFKKEARAAARLGLPASYETKLSLPFETLGAVRFSGQASFHVGKYIQALAKLVHGKGSRVYEHSQAQSIKDGDPCTVETPDGSVTAKAIVVATRIPTAPLIARVGYAALEHPHTSHIVAGNYSGGLRGMYISPDKGHYSLLPVKDDDEELLLIGGENHTPGLGLPGRRYDKLERYAYRWFGIDPIKYRWKAMDYMAYDNLPVAGLLYPWSKNMYAITGLKKWGLNLSMVAATVVRDQILSQKNSVAPFLRPSRTSAPAAIPRTLADYLR